MDIHKLKGIDLHEVSGLTGLKDFFANPNYEVEIFCPFCGKELASEFVSSLSEEAWISVERHHCSRLRQDTPWIMPVNSRGANARICLDYDEIPDLHVQCDGFDWFARVAFLESKGYYVIFASDCNRAKCYFLYGWRIKSARESEAFHTEALKILSKLGENNLITFASCFGILNRNENQE